MQFEHLEDTDQWASKINLRQHEVGLRIIDGYTPDERNTLAASVIDKVTSQWEQVESNLTNSLLEMYNENWSDPEEGFPKVDRDGFLKRIELDSISIMEDGAFSLYFSDSGLFGEHVIDIFWDGDKMYDAAIAG